VLRFISAWFGTLSCGADLSAGARSWVPPANRLLAAILLAASPYFIWHSQDARMYALSTALTLASTVCWWMRCVAKSRHGAVHPALWLGYAATCWLALQVHYFAVFVFGGAGSLRPGLALSGGIKTPYARGPGWARQGPGALCYLPWPSSSPPRR